jgi:aspartate-semialdehyde dehydrogenase
MKNKARVRIAIVGCTGLVGRMFARVLSERKIEAEYILFNRSGGSMVEILGRTYVTNPLTVDNVNLFGACDFALFSAGSEVSKAFAPLFAEKGAIVIDNSSAFRRDAKKLLVIPECNGELLKNVLPGAIISNPNCTTIGSLPALKPLDDAFKLESVVYSSYQAISGAGGKAMLAFQNGTHAVINNVIPFIDGEEEKMAHETRKILGHSDISVVATCMRVSVPNCHTVAVHAKFKTTPTVEQVKTILSKASGVVLLNDDELPSPIVANDHDEVFVGRVRVVENTVCFVTASDNIRKGAATNAVQILQKLI